MTFSFFDNEKREERKNFIEAQQSRYTIEKRMSVHFQHHHRRRCLTTECCLMCRLKGTRVSTRWHVHGMSHPLFLFINILCVKRQK
jgi:hypothetical protein